jgi:hypothetical protein
VGELLQRIGSQELAEWIVELGQLRPADEKAAMEKAEREAKTGPSPRPLTRADVEGVN